VLPIVLWRGLDPRKIGPVAAYVLVALTAGLFGTSLPGLTVSQTATSIATLSLAWIVFSVHWEWQRDRGLLKVLALTPAVTLAASAVLHVVSGLQLTTATHPVRLEGATLAAWLATVSLAATLSCLALFGRDRWRWSVPLAVLNLALLCATFTRGALLALLLATSPAIVRFARRRVAGQGLRLFAIALVALGAVIVLAPGVRERDAQATTHSVGGAGQHDLTSGRLRAWHFAYEQAKVNLLFGRGVGAGPVAGRSPGSPAGFVAQHNEYVRMLLEGGAVGALILLASMVAAVAACIRRAPSMMRSDLAAAGVAMAVYSITENTLSALPLAVALLLYIAIAGSESRHRRGELHGAT
jgi:O-antigen ligase